MALQDIFNKLAPQGDMAPPGPWSADEPPPRPQGEDSGQDAAVLQSILSFYDRFTSENATSESLQAASVARSTDSASPPMIQTSPPCGTSAMHESERSAKSPPAMKRMCGSPSRAPRSRSGSS